MNNKIEKDIKQNRKAIKPQWSVLRDTETAYSRKEERPPLFKDAPEGATIIDLDRVFPHVKHKSLHDCIQNRRSLRQYGDAPLDKEEVSYLLNETARVTEVRRNAVFRTIPTGGATNAMETYVYINKVDGMDQGLYLYLQNEHKLALIDDKDNLPERVNAALYQQLRGASIVVIMTTVPARSEYKYSFCAHKMIAMEAGHAGQNLSLAAEVVDAGACAIAAYHQDKMDELLQVDGVEEFSTYALTVGKKPIE